MSAPTTPAPKHLIVLHPERLPSGGGFLLLPSVLSQHDFPRLIALLADRPLAFLVEKDRPLPAGLQSHLDSLQAPVVTFLPDPEHQPAFQSTLQQLTSEGRAIIHLPAAAATLLGTAYLEEVLAAIPHAGVAAIARDRLKP